MNDSRLVLGLCFGGQSALYSGNSTSCLPSVFSHVSRAWYVCSGSADGSRKRQYSPARSLPPSESAEA